MANLTAEQEVRRPVLGASWLTMTFAHWRVAPEEVRPLLPDGLAVDEHDGSAWVTLAAFLFADVRPLAVGDLPAALARSLSGALPRLPDLSSTPQTNVRTYVRAPDGRDGLWLFSLDVGSAVLAAALRASTGAAYRAADLSVAQEAGRVRYAGSRDDGSASYRLVVRPSGPVTPSDTDVWLTGRWRAYTRHAGQLLVAPVEHEPWPLQDAAVEELDQDLTSSAGFPGLSEPDLVHYSDGVRRVRMGVPRPLSA
jgi:uncharacterized protein YqjF (DUF2071 family)